jgi:hypothetical protein
MLRLAVSHTIALETPRGLRLAKEKTSHKIDAVIPERCVGSGNREIHPPALH